MRIAATLLTAVAMATACGGQDPELNEATSSSQIKPKDFSAAMAVAWNQRVNDISFAEDQWFTLKGVRAHAMMHIAMHDALNAIESEYDHYAYNGSQSNASPIAAGAQAAYDVVVAAYPGESAQLTTELNTWLNTVPNGAAKTNGITLGHASASAIIALRTGDNFDAPGSYTFSPPAPGVYQTYPPFDGFVFGPGWALATPFTMTSQSQFRPPPPPAINSNTYTAAYAEVALVGKLNSLVRTADQTHAGLWWREFTEGSMNRLGRQLATSKNMNLWTSTRMFAQLNMNMFDGYVSTFESKFFYNFWRPFTAIRTVNDGNVLTIPDPTWENTTQFTPPFPTYGSAHSTVCATSMSVFKNTFGNNTSFTMTSNGAPPPNSQTRSFTSFTGAATECANSRIWLGYHFRFDCTAGTNAGNAITAYAKSHYLEVD